MLEITPALIGGILIGLSASFVMLLYGRIAGISGMIQSLTRSKNSNSVNSLAFLTGMALGAFCLSLVKQIHPQPTDTHPALIILSGLLVGYGTALGSGCTSGHGVCGISRLSLRSIIATLCFMLSGIITVYLARHVL